MCKNEKILMREKEKSGEKAVGSERSVWLCDVLDGSYLIPLLESVLQNGTVLPGTQMMPSCLEMSSDGTEGGKKALRVFGGRESPHLLFTQEQRLMRMFRTIVQPFVQPMLHPWQDLTFCCSITFQCLGDHHPWRVLKPIRAAGEKNVLPLACYVGFAPGYPARCHPDLQPSRERAFSRRSLR